MAFSIFLNGSQDDLSECIHIRQEVFGLEQNFCSASKEDLDDRDAFIVVVYDNIYGEKVAVGTGRLLIKDDFFKIGRIAVKKEFRGKKYGEFIVKRLIEKAEELGATKIHVGAQAHAISFYSRLGFSLEEDTYLEDDIFHQHMTIDLI